VRRVRLVWRASGPRSPLSRFVGGSLTVHVLAAIVLVSLPALRGSDRRPVASVAVQLVAAPPSPLPTVRAAAPPPAEVPAPTVPAPVEAPKEPKPKPKEKPKPKPQPVKTPPETTQVDTEPAQTSGSGATPGTPDRETPASGTGGAAIEALDIGSDEFAWYRASVTAALHSRWQRPILEELTEASEVVVAFDIGRDGTVHGLRVERSSGVPMLDRSALRAVAEASPLPPLPKALPKDVLSATFVFRLLPE
jgi:TonB family protein